MNPPTPTPEAAAKAQEAARRHAERLQRPPNAGWTLLFGIAAAVVSIGAGIYLLASESASQEATVFDSLMHGIGAYFLARGLWMIRELVHRP